MYRRRYAGRRLAWLRAELLSHYPGLILVWRDFPRPVRVMALGTYVAMFAAAAGPVNPMFLLAGVRAMKPRGVPTQLPETLDAVDASALLDKLRAYRPTGRQGYPLRALWRAYMVSFLLGLPSTNALIRRLQNDRALRLLCGVSVLPHRTTFNRADHQATGPATRTQREGGGRLHDRAVPLESQAQEQTDRPGERPRGELDRQDQPTREERKGVGMGLQVPPRGRRDLRDTALRVHHDRQQKRLARAAPPAGRGERDPALADPQVRDGRQGIRQQGEPQGREREGRRSNRADQTDPRGLYEGIYTEKGVPTCIGMVEMEYVRSDPQKGHLYRCRREACHLKTRPKALTK